MLAQLYHDETIFHKKTVKSIKTWYGERLEVHAPAVRNRERFRKAVLTMVLQERNMV